MVWVLIGFLALCGVIALSPNGGIRAALASAWGIMALFAVGAIVIAIGRAIA